MLVGFLAAAMVAPVVSGTGFLTNPRGQVFFSDRSGVYCVNPDSGAELVLENRPARRLLFDLDGNLCGEVIGYDGAADMLRPTLWCAQPDGRIVEFAVSGPRTAFAYSEVVDRQGRLYFWEGDAKRSRSRILTRGKGTPPHLLAGHDWGWQDGRGAAARLGCIGAMCLGPDDCLYFTDDLAVRRIAPDGTVTTLARGGLLAAGRSDTDLANPLASIAVDGSSQIYVANRCNRRILRLAPDGTVAPVAESESGWTPAGVVWFDDRLLVLEAGPHGNRALRCGPDGRLTPLPGQTGATTAPRPARAWVLS